VSVQPGEVVFQPAYHSSLTCFESQLVLFERLVSNGRPSGRLEVGSGRWKTTNERLRWTAPDGWLHWVGEGSIWGEVDSNELKPDAGGPIQLLGVSGAIGASEAAPSGRLQ